METFKHHSMCPFIEDTDNVIYGWNACQCDLIESVEGDAYKRGYDAAVLDLAPNLQIAYEQGYKKAEKFYTNDCMLCGYMGEWSTYICDDCIKENDEDSAI